jgi:hypothetical protein
MSTALKSPVAKKTEQIDIQERNKRYVQIDTVG